MAEDRYIYDQFRKIAASAAGLARINLLYLYGDPREIIQNLREITRDPIQLVQKYPLLALFTDIEQRQGEIPGIESKVRLNFIIAMLTTANYSSEERIELNFKPTLYPLFDAIMESIFRSGFYQLQSAQSIPRVKYDRLFWGRNGLYLEEGNVFEDLIDCIEVQNLELSIINKTNF